MAIFIEFKNACLESLIFTKPGPADSADSMKENLERFAAKFFDSSAGFFFKIPAAIMHTFDVICPFDRSSVIDVVYFF